MHRSRVRLALLAPFGSNRKSTEGGRIAYTEYLTATSSGCQIAFFTTATMAGMSPPSKAASLDGANDGCLRPLVELLCVALWFLKGLFNWSSFLRVKDLAVPALNPNQPPQGLPDPPHQNDSADEQRSEQTAGTAVGIDMVSSGTRLVKPSSGCDPSGRS